MCLRYFQPPPQTTIYRSNGTMSSSAATGWRPIVTVKAIRNGLTVFAIVYLIIRGLVARPASNSFVLGGADPAPPLSPQDQAFVARCRTFYEQSAMRRTHCDDPPAALCQNVCSSLASNLTYYATLWPSSLLAACDATCAAYQGQICNGAISYVDLCDATARTRMQASVVDNVHVTVHDDRTGPSFLALLVLIFVAASDILVSVAEYKAKYLISPTDDAALYDASQLDASAALFTQALHAAEQPEHLVTVAKTCFEIRCLLFDNSCDEALQVIVVFQLASLLWNIRRRSTHLLPSVRLDFKSQQPVPTASPPPDDEEGEFQHARTASASKKSTEFSKAQSMAAFTQQDVAKSSRINSREMVQPVGVPEAVAPVGPLPSSATTPTPPPAAQKAFGKLTRLIGK
ncbi:hypothetical protein DYB32_001968 [Aphanomyces invadans]|uniref:Uncharacterized protein n=1 Tax=Aphanomyces invadans TaxID=157072 RepID=A0A418B4T1_9STRA|nr:hypothetical protein DYB32_001968 [Aphanomyces invadans]